MAGEIITLASGIFFFLTNVSGYALTPLYWLVFSVSTRYCLVASPTQPQLANRACSFHYGNVSLALRRLRTSS